MQNELMCAAIASPFSQSRLSSRGSVAGDERGKVHVEELRSNGHVQLMKRVLHDEVAVEYIDSLQQSFQVRCMRFRREEEQSAGDRAERLENKRIALQRLDAARIG